MSANAVLIWAILSKIKFNIYFPTLFNNLYYLRLHILKMEDKFYGETYSFSVKLF